MADRFNNVGSLLQVSSSHGVELARFALFLFPLGTRLPPMLMILSIGTAGFVPELICAAGDPFFSIVVHLILP
jgi:hypothetical protein